MSYLALYREWRPRTFDEVVEQKQAVYALRQAVISRQIGHAYLFSGTRGTGKTTLAKIFSRAINCLDPQQGNPCNHCEICRGVLDGSLLDVVEMDAASNNSVDNIRRITDEVNFMPSRARFKVYIIDEVHMLTPGAFNALLKTLEEPPAHAVFILATTEPHRIPATILSRCQRYDFRRIPVESIVIRLAEISQKDGIAIDQSGLETIAAFADGALRDAISLLDQAKMSVAGTISRDDILALAGLTKDDALLALADALIAREAALVLDLIDQLVMAGRDLSRLIPDLAQLFRNLLICLVSDRPEKLIQATAEGLATMRQLATKTTQQQLLSWIRGLSAMLTDLRWAADARTLLEVGLIRLMTEDQDGHEIIRQVMVQPIAMQPITPAATAPATVPATAPATAPATLPIAPPIVVAKTVAPVIPATPAEPAEPAELVESSDISFTDETPFPDDPPMPEEIFLDASPAPKAVPIVAEQDGAALWQKVLSRLSESGQMTLFLFGRTAKAQQPTDTVLRVIFAQSEKVHSDEFRAPAAQKILRDCLHEITGKVFEVQVLTEGSVALSNSPGTTQHQVATTQPDQPEWMTKLQTTADTFGIPMIVED
ncbi:MAG: DNA polymerase III subunit gamma/tau [Eubacteriales bacterium]|nr:DNA polymerase III subunit gamma/tau [Eubacteriales bacterium]